MSMSIYAAWLGLVLLRPDCELLEAWAASKRHFWQCRFGKDQNYICALVIITLETNSNWKGVWIYYSSKEKKVKRGIVMYFFLLVSAPHFNTFLKNFKYSFTYFPPNKNPLKWWLLAHCREMMEVPMFQFDDTIAVINQAWNFIISGALGPTSF